MATAMSNPRVAVVGAGVSGLACAERLTRAGIEVHVLEAASRVGGVIETVRGNDRLLEAAADGFATVPEDAIATANNLGLSERLLSLQSGPRRVWLLRRGQLRPFPWGMSPFAPLRIWPLIRSKLLTWSEAVRAACEWAIPPRGADEDESIAAFTRRRFGEGVYRSLVQPMLSGIYAANPEQLSLEAVMPVWADLERRHGGVLRGMGKSSGEHGESQRPSGGMRAVDEGMTRFVAALEQSLPPGAVRLRTRVQSVRQTADGWQVEIVGERSERPRYDGVVLAVPAPVTASILESLDAPWSALLRRIHYQSCAVVHLAYSEQDLRLPESASGVLLPFNEGRNALAVSVASRKYPGRAGQGEALLRVFMGGGYHPGLLALPDDDLVWLAEQECNDLFQATRPPHFRHVFRHTSALPRYDVGHSRLVREIEQRNVRFNTLALAGNAYHGIGVAHCVRSGHKAADQVLIAMNQECDGESVSASSLAHDAIGDSR